ncbi:protein C12orf4-like isoform X1 [Pecten maximus]|uniref:protein C12orf4-like isoform X1 n=1 Tax=Pecten maximus TaxID=6579 RepID=UPI001459131F|nr:protein C12orf4-like isoform X1 [Pecten maximus]XP_033747334.1 protein C12orf4-like isoform X1 [Pecten maximus]
MSATVKKDFEFVFSSKEQKSKLTVPITIPLSQTRIKEFVGRLVTAHDLPCYVEEDLRKQLQTFVTKESSRLFDEHAEEVMAKVTKDAKQVDDLVVKWTKAYNQEVKTYAKTEEVSQEQRFSEVYHSLIHSPALDTLLNLEHTYSLTVEDLIHQRDKDLEHLEERQGKDMQQALNTGKGNTYTDEQISQLAQRHFDNAQLIESKWTSELNNLKEIQKREFREWIIKVHEDTQTPAKSPSYIGRVRAMSNTLPEAEEEERTSAITRLEESFTVHLGAQMKTTHNLRLLCTDVLDLCRHKTHTVGGLVIPQPQRLQTAMSLYSNNLCGLILMVDNRLNSYTGIKRDFSKVCEQSTDFHFPSLDQQFSNVDKEIAKFNELKAQKKMSEEGDKISIKSSSSSSSGDTQLQDKGNKIQVGDFYITKHSNLSEVHTVFHLVMDDSTRSIDISSRHPVILSIRNIIKLCFRSDITTLTIPLLLSHEMSEEMTIQWCQRRAELMFKCVKGFMMEMVTYGGQNSRTIQFLVPCGLSEEMFASISNLLTTIFRLSNPVVVKSSQASHVGR